MAKKGKKALDMEDDTLVLCTISEESKSIKEKKGTIDVDINTLTPHKALSRNRNDVNH